MEKLTNIRPVYLYLLSAVFFIFSRASEDGSFMSYLLLILGIIILITAFVNYFRN